VLLPDRSRAYRGTHRLNPRAPVFAAPIEDYALIGDCISAALVSREGAIDWLCWPRFDSSACLAALLGTPEHGQWRICPADPHPRITRAYRDGTLVLETVFTTATGEVALIDLMSIGVGGSGAEGSAVVRIVEGRRGRVDMHLGLTLRFGDGNTEPWVTRLPEGHGILAIAGPDLVVLHAGVKVEGRGMSTQADFTVAEGETVTFTLAYGPSHLPPPARFDPLTALHRTEAFWTQWNDRCSYKGPYAAEVRRSLVTLKALTYAPTGGIVAAPTTSLPEQLGGVRNWDYRFCWLRDATLTLLAFMDAGYFDEAQAWRGWLHRAVAGSPDQIQIMYGIAGERRLSEWSVPWLPGYQGAAPVRIGNAAHDQLQLDVFGEVMDALHQAREGGLAAPEEAWDVQLAMLVHLEDIWQLPDEGIWETRGGRRDFTFSKVMAWVAFDRGIRSAERFGLEAPLDRWREVRDTIHRTVCDRGFDKARGSFVQSFGSQELDASLLLIPHMGFLPADDPRVIGTVAAIERELLVDGFVRRYDTSVAKDGLPPGEGVFLPCSFWLAEIYAAQGRYEDAEALFRRLLALRNDLGLLSEEYDPASGRLVGNFPQAFSHLALVCTAMTLAGAPASDARSGKAATPPAPARSVAADAVAAPDK
jgi:GH15 family glucan-1,4-alpha-glucosidase